MVEKQVILKNEDGLHGRAASSFVRHASSFQSNIKIISKDVSVNGKSIIGIMSLGAFHGEELTIRAEGPDEEKAIEELVNVVNNNFGL